jgi:hypothetical protein
MNEQPLLMPSTMRAGGLLLIWEVVLGAPAAGAQGGRLHACATCRFHVCYAPEADTCKTLPILYHYHTVQSPLSTQQNAWTGGATRIVAGTQHTPGVL